MFIFVRHFLHEDLLGPSLCLEWPCLPLALFRMSHITSHLVLELLQATAQALPASWEQTWLSILKAELAYLALHFLGLQWGEGICVFKSSPEDSSREPVVTEAHHLHRGQGVPVGNILSTQPLPQIQVPALPQRWTHQLSPTTGSSRVWSPFTRL